MSSILALYALVLLALYAFISLADREMLSSCTVRAQCQSPDRYRWSASNFI
jgi:hypothetical protein